MSSGNYRRPDEFDPATNPALRRYIETAVGSSSNHAVGSATWDALPSRLCLDRQAIDTVGNFTALAPELRRRRVRRLLVVTSQYHVDRAAACAAIVLGSHEISYTVWCPAEDRMTWGMAA